MQVGDVAPGGEGGGQGAQDGRPAAAGAAGDEQVVAAVEVEGDRCPALLGGQVEQADREPAVGHRYAGQVVDRDDLGQRRQPRAVHRLGAEPRGRRAGGVDQPGEVGGAGRCRACRSDRRIADWAAG